MDFELLTSLTAPDGTLLWDNREVFYTPDKLMEALHGHISNWNVLNPDATLRFTLNKIPNDVPTLGVGINEDVDVKALFG